MKLLTLYITTIVVGLAVGFGLDRAGYHGGVGARTIQIATMLATWAIVGYVWRRAKGDE